MAEESREQLRSELSGAPPSELAPKTTKPALKLEQPKVVTLKHNDRCPALRRDECTCAGNLQWLIDAQVKPLEVKTCTFTEKEVVAEKWTTVQRTVELWRVDDGKDHVRTLPGLSQTAKPIVRKERLPPRWICTRCGWACRGSDVSHRCDMSSVVLAKRQQTLGEMLTPEQKHGGDYRLVTWRDQDQKYHLAEEFVWSENGQLHRKTVELLVEDTYDVFEAALLDAHVDRFSP